jgi:hypothetical protein
MCSTRRTRLQARALERVLTVASFLNRETNSMKAPNGADFRALRVANTAKLRMCLRQRGVAEKRDSDNGDLEVDYIRI